MSRARSLYVAVVLHADGPEALVRSHYIFHSPALHSGSSLFRGMLLLYLKFRRPRLYFQPRVRLCPFRMTNHRCVRSPAAVAYVSLS